MTWTPADWQGWPLPPGLIEAVRERMSTISIPVYSASRSFLRNINRLEVRQITDAQVHLLVVTAWRFRRQMGSLAPPERIAKESQAWLTARQEEAAVRARAALEDRQARRVEKRRRAAGMQAGQRLI